MGGCVVQNGEGEDVRLDAGCGVEGMAAFGGVDYRLWNVSRRHNISKVAGA